jgi:hypothetical protein
MNRDLIQALVDLSTATQKATRAAREAGDTELVKQLRALAWHVAGLLSDAVRSNAIEVAS